MAEAAKDQEGLTEKQLAEQIGTMNHPDRIAALRRLDDKKKLDLIPRDTLKRMMDPSTKDLFKNYGYEQLHGGVRDKTGLEFERLAGNLDKAETAGDRAEVDKAFDEMMKYSRAAPDAGFLASTYFINEERLNELNAEGRAPAKSYKDLEKLQGSAAKMVGQFSPQTASTFFKDLARGDQLEQFKKAAAEANIEEKDISPNMDKWLSGTGAQNLGIDRELFGLGERKEKPPLYDQYGNKV